MLYNWAMHKKIIMKKIIFFFLILSSQALVAQDSTEYSVYHNTRKSGFLKINRMADGWNTIRYAYRDRGTKVNQLFTIKTDSKGAFEQFAVADIQPSGDTMRTKAFKDGKKFKQIVGKDTAIRDFKSLVLDRYLFSRIEEFIFPILQDTSLHGEQIYEKRKMTEQSFTLNGKIVKSELWGLYTKAGKYPALSAWYYPNQRLMASINFWGAIIANEMEPLKTQLKKLSDSAIYARGQQASNELFSKTINRFALYNCNVVDIEKGVLLKHQTVLVEKSKIKNIGDTLTIKIPDGFTIINAENKTVMPGLWDLHTHYAHPWGYSYFLNGVTSVRDLGNSADIDIIEQKTKQDLLAGPRIAWKSGFIDNMDDYAGPCGILINTLEEGIKAVHDYKKKGYKSIKLYSSIKPEFVKPLAAEAHKLGMKVHGHIPAFMTAIEAIENGYDEINHINLAMLGFYGNKFDNRVGRGPLMATMANKISPHGEYGKQLTQLMKEHNTVMEDCSVLLTQALPKKLITARDSSIAASVDTVYAWLKALRQNGIRMVPGADGSVSAGLLSGLKNYVTAGFSNAEVLQMATIDAAAYCGWNKQLGTVTKGKLADLIVLDEDPLLNIAALGKINMVIANGKLFYIKDLKAVNPSSGDNSSGSFDDED